MFFSFLKKKKSGSGTSRICLSKIINKLKSKLNIEISFKHSNLDIILVIETIRS